jgi:hypothetical protein
MDILKSKTLTGVTGAIFVPAGMNQDKIIKVSRQGMQKDYISFLFFTSMTGSQWSFISGGVKRIVFGADFPLTEGEEIHIIYKI